MSKLVVEYAAGESTIRALDGGEMRVSEGEIVGIVGESGSGKSTLSRALAGLLPSNATVLQGDVRIKSVSMLGSSEEVRRDVRRGMLGFVFQSPIASLNPTMTVRRQLAVELKTAPDADADEDRADPHQLLRQVGLDDAIRVGRSYPHQLSGGMAQRVAIARAIARRPPVIVADEPTASLDVGYRDEILDLLVDQRDCRGASLILLTHDLRSVARVCDKVAVMYAGRIVEFDSGEALFRSPSHPYTIGLLKAAPGTEAMGARLDPIGGVPATLAERAEMCTFAPRCPYAIEICREVRPEAEMFGEREVVCHRASEIRSGRLPDEDQ